MKFTITARFVVEVADGGRAFEMAKDALSSQFSKYEIKIISAGDKL